MPGWFVPKCPVSLREKVWIERRMRWLADRLGIDRLLDSRTVLPDASFFSEPYAGTEDHACLLLKRLCGPFGIDPRGVGFEVLADDRVEGAIGLYERGDPGRPVIRVIASLLRDPIGLVATLAHELAHELLLGRGLLTEDDSDHEWVTDLLTVYLGLGVFTANATITEEYRRHKHRAQPRLEAYGYLTSQQFGYALALCAFMRGEERPAWASHLRLDATSTFRDGLRFLRKAGDSLFHPSTIHERLAPVNAAEVVHRLRAGGSDVRIATLWDIVDQPVRDPEVIEAVGERLGDREEQVRAEAAVTIGSFGPVAADWVPQLIRALEGADDQTRASGAFALGALCARAADCVPVLRDLVNDPADRVVWAACTALCQFGGEAESALPRLLDALLSAVIDCDYALGDHLVGALRAVTADPFSLARARLANVEPELRERAFKALRGVDL